VAAPLSAFLWGSTPFLCARAKKWGGTGSWGQNPPPNKTAHPHNPPTSTSPLQKSGEERIDYRLVALTRMVEPPGQKSAFLWRLDTVSLGKHQRNGVESQDKPTPPPSVSAHTY